MKLQHLFFAILCSIILKPSFGQEQLYYQGFQDSLFSEILGEKRQLLIYLPQSTRSLKMGQSSSPVVYLLDANSQFSISSQIIKQLSFDAVPPSILVGIVNTNRTRDLTPTPIADDPTGFDVSQSGGGESFLDFIEKELIPYIDQKYATTPYRTFIGHSLGGLFSGYLLATRPHLFKNVISLDPTSNWDNGLLVKKLKEAADQGKLAGKGYVFAVADPEPTGIFKIDSLMSTFRIPNEQIRDYLNPRSDVRFLYKNYSKGSHSDMVIPGIYDGMKFLFSWYADLQQELVDAADPIVGTSQTTEELITKIESIYQRMSDEFGYKVKPQEDLINNLGYWSLQAGDLERSKLFFEMNVQNYPESANVYDSMGDYYLAAEQPEDAARFFEVALMRDENQQTRKKLEELQARSKN
ncbi:alpha/beta hydrolase-fold protein [Algoriphagus sp. CAU 1675]|uniref:alpha/beta hydrolase-fold protein n=1 Tax=Algoriphagus sp. CAU 1675 TaxID=3032597 RepID=UPI0023DC0576|nr:alpha/beta hydrolase-fold protein [Algoriphagus sp. CAU 1675]MDF2156469.1 alpha/beta hydrolase-fold protein [Algoriphagus sp. CAU 1675]